LLLKSLIAPLSQKNDPERFSLRPFASAPRGYEIYEQKIGFDMPHNYAKNQLQQ